MTSDNFTNWQKKTLFLCKRGNIETELLLQDYIQSLTPSAPSAQKNLIDALLNESEQNLFHWLLGTQNSTIKPVEPVPDQYLSLISEIRHNYLNSNR